MIKRLKDKYKRLIRPLDELYLKYRDRLPAQRYLKYASIPVGVSKKHLDIFFPSTRIYADVGDYEAAIVMALNEYVKPGDRIVVVGGGVGVTSCVAASKAGILGKVFCYEGNRGNVKIIEETVKINKLEKSIQVFEGIVGSDLGVYAGEKSSVIISACNLPNCDLLQLDCEGAEVGIISAINFLPRVIIVETHGYLGAPTAEVVSLLEGRGYSTKNFGPAEPRLESVCVKNDIYVVVAELHGIQGLS